MLEEDAVVVEVEMSDEEQMQWEHRFIYERTR